ncbi:hypothetical protein SteCoe_9659 [Stentor coeruleus]|uniref:FCP1 homology domain-containing protein n=1 Tax=Stentor coeruleus TaxID=5963 RepID=A0A1R2CHK2_9CILI|nr:hypothetical protein SteCoe_9659 [Stentor coeruleus]
MSRNQRIIKYFSNNQRVPSVPRLTDDTNEVSEENFRLDPTLKNSPSNSRGTLGVMWPPVSHKPRTPSCKPIVATEKLPETSTPKCTKDAHPIPYTFMSKPNALSSRGQSKSAKVLPKKVEEKKSDLSELITQVKSAGTNKKKTSLSPEEIKSRSEVYYREHLFQTFQALKFVKNLPSVDVTQLRQKRVNFNKKPGYENKKTIVFDLDETLVHCVDDINAEPDVVLAVRFPTGEMVNAGINIRPFAKECLVEASKNFEVIVFTASHKCYADVVLDYLDPSHEIIHHRLYRENCLVVEGVFMKDLRIFANRRIQDIVIIDNAAYSFGYQIDNGIPIISWHDDEYDRELFNLMDYLKILSTAEDVREVNRQIFHLRTFYEDYIQEFLKGDRSKGVSPRHNSKPPKY